MWQFFHVSICRNATGNSRADSIGPKQKHKKILTLKHAYNTRARNTTVNIGELKNAKKDIDSSAICKI